MAEPLINFDAHLNGTQKFKATLALLSMNDSQKKRLLQKIGRKAKSHSTKNQQKQETPDGKKWDKRKNKRKDGSRKKMMSGLKQLLTSFSDSERMKLTFHNTMMAKLAYSHHHGIGEEFNVEQNKVEQHSTGQMKTKMTVARYENKLNRNQIERATKKQAKTLIDGGFRIKKRKEKNGKRRNGGKGKIPSMRYITTNFSRGLAGLLIRQMGIDTGYTKSVWRMPRPRRPFVGMNWKETQEMADFIIDEIVAQMN